MKPRDAGNDSLIRRTGVKVTRREAEDEFVVRFYRWAQADFQRHVDENFALLRAIRSKSIFRILPFVETLSVPERKALGVALVKRFHEEAVKLTGERISADDAEWVRRYLAFAREPCREEHIMGARGLTGGTTKINRKTLLVEAKRRLAPLLQPAQEKTLGSSLVLYDTMVCGFPVGTIIDVGGRSHQLAYSQAIGVVVGGNAALAVPTNLLCWLGISGCTQWHYLTNDDIPGAVDSLASACSRFLSAAPSLLVGITVDS